MHACTHLCPHFPNIKKNSRPPGAQCGGSALGSAPGRSYPLGPTSPIPPRCWPSTCSHHTRRAIQRLRITPLHARLLSHAIGDYCYAVTTPMLSLLLPIWSAFTHQIEKTIASVSEEKGGGCYLDGIMQLPRMIIF